MRKLLGSLTVALMLAIPVGAQAQVTVGPVAALHGDADLGIGALVAFPLEQVTEGFGLHGDFVFYFPDGFDYWELTAAATWDVPVEDAPVMPFVLGGLNFASFSAEAVSVPGFGTVGGGSTSEIGLSLGGGIKFDAGSLNPLVGVRLVTPFSSTFELFGAIPFQLGD